MNSTEGLTYDVVVNNEEQYSIWSVSHELPGGWYKCNFSGSKTSCLRYIMEVWTDMRPLSLREDVQETLVPLELSLGEELVDLLVQQRHMVRVKFDAESSANQLKSRIDNGLIHLELIDTEGDINLAMHLDRSQSQYADTNFDAAVATVSLVGNLTVDLEPIVCAVTIDLATCTGLSTFCRTAR